MCLEVFTRCQNGLRKKPDYNKFCVLWVYSGYYCLFRVQMVCGKRSDSYQLSISFESYHVPLVHFWNYWCIDLNAYCRYFFAINKLAELFDSIPERSSISFKSKLGFDRYLFCKDFNHRAVRFGTPPQCSHFLFSGIAFNPHLQCNAS